MSTYRIRIPLGNREVSRIEVAQAGSVTAGYQAEFVFDSSEFSGKDALYELLRLFANKVNETTLTGL